MQTLTSIMKICLRNGRGLILIFGSAIYGCYDGQGYDPGEGSSSTGSPSDPFVTGSRAWQQGGPSTNGASSSEGGFVGNSGASSSSGGSGFGGSSGLSGSSETGASYSMSGSSGLSG